VSTTPTDETVARTLSAIVEHAIRAPIVREPELNIVNIAGHDDRPDYFYLELGNGQRFKVEVTEVYDGRPS